jgi:probable HAF family extracellular repeat protein
MRNHQPGISAISLALLITCVPDGALAGPMRPMPTHYTVTQVGPGEGVRSSYPTGLSNNGKVAGRWYGYHDEKGSFLYRDGLVTKGSNLIADINDKGRITEHPTDSAITDAGATAGSRWFTQPDGSQHLRASYRRTPDSPLLDIIGDRGIESFATAVNDYHQVVGRIRENLYYELPFLYSNGETTTLWDEASGLGGGVASDINNRGQVVGTRFPGQNSANPWYQSAGNDSRPFLYQDGELLPLDGWLSEGHSGAYGINLHGDIVGYSTFDGEGHAVLYRDGVLHDLNDLLPPESGWLIQSATKINDKGQILATAYRPGIENYYGSQAVLLHPVPEPAPIALLGLGLAVAGWRRWRMGSARG